jgi:hypothetical protein
MYTYTHKIIFIYVFISMFLQFREGAAPTDGFSFQSIVSRPHSTGMYTCRYVFADIHIRVYICVQVVKL